MSENDSPIASENESGPELEVQSICDSEDGSVQDPDNEAQGEASQDEGTYLHSRLPVLASRDLALAGSVKRRLRAGYV